MTEGFVDRSSTYRVTPNSPSFRDIDPMDISLTDREADVMQVLWTHGPALVAEVRDRLPDPLAYTTVLTVLRTLEAKGYVAHEPVGRGYRYRAAVPRAAARLSALSHLAHKLFEGSSELLFAHLVSERKLTPEAIARMRSMLDAAGDAEGPKPDAAASGKKGSSC